MIGQRPGLLNFRQEKPSLKATHYVWPGTRVKIRQDKTFKDDSLSCLVNSQWFFCCAAVLVAGVSFAEAHLKCSIMSKKHNMESVNIWWNLFITIAIGRGKADVPTCQHMQGISLQGQVLTNVLHSQMKLMIDLGPDLEKPPEASYKKVTWSQVQKSHLKPGTKKSPEARPQICFRTVRQHHQSRNPCLSSLRCFVL